MMVLIEVTAEKPGSYAISSMMQSERSEPHPKKLRRVELRRSLERCGFLVVPSSDLLVGNLGITKSERTPFRLQELRKQYGKTYAIMQGAFPTVVTSDINVILDVCLKKFRFFHSRMTDPTNGDPDISREVHMFAARGERWKRIRSLTSPALSTHNLKKNLTYDVISRCCLGRAESCQTNDPNLELLLKKFSPHQVFYRW
ncbi:unnamed protein product [Toxocara canis]|uniref:Cytochrome P450 n=1 Tax=Toxocara canis TaxID=6265 RepID=A0A183V8J4_TOXCA|nr:unnamed protein product [Toxocara canis]